MEGRRPGRDREERVLCSGQGLEQHGLQEQPHRPCRTFGAPAELGRGRLGPQHLGTHRELIELFLVLQLF